MLINSEILQVRNALQPFIKFKEVCVVLPQVNIADTYRQSWSIMPEGLEAGLSPQDMADLMEYVLSAPLTAGGDSL